MLQLFFGRDSPVRQSQKCVPPVTQWHFVQLLICGHLLIAFLTCHVLLLIDLPTTMAPVSIPAMNRLLFSVVQSFLGLSRTYLNCKAVDVDPKRSNTKWTDGDLWSVQLLLWYVSQNVPKRPRTAATYQAVSATKKVCMFFENWVSVTIETEWKCVIAHEQMLTFSKNIREQHTLDPHFFQNTFPAPTFYRQKYSVLHINSTYRPSKCQEVPSSGFITKCFQNYLIEDQSKQAEMAGKGDKQSLLSHI